MYKGDTIPGIITTTFGLLFVISTITSNVLSIDSTTSDGVPGAGFFPVLLGSIVVFLGILLIIKGLRQKGKITYINNSDETKLNIKVLLLTVAGLVVFFVFWQISHMFVIGIFLLSLYLNFIFKRSKKFTIIYSTVFTALIYLVFTLGFSIQFGI